MPGSENNNINKPIDYKKLLAFTPSPILILLPDSPRFTILEVSNAYLKATMTSREEILGQGIFEVFPDNPADPAATGTKNLRSSLERVIKYRQAHTMAIQKYDIQRPKSEGGGFEERFWSPINVPVCDSKNNVINIIHRVEDVTEFIHLKQAKAEQSKITEELRALTSEMEVEIYKRAQEIQDINNKLSEAYEKLGELDKLKTKFFSNVSHEFRTPLTLMLGPLDDILSDRANPVQKEHQQRLELIRKNCLRLQRLVNNLLDFSRIEVGRIDARFQATDIVQFTCDLASVFRSVMEKAGLDFVLDCPLLKERIYVDQEMWEKILFNLLSNALKFTIKGEVRLSLREKEKEIELTISDTGSGIPYEEQSSLFQRFHRIKGSSSRIQEGTGIGLALVYEFVKLHGGSINVESEVGKGSTFTVCIPKGTIHLPQDRIVSEADGDNGQYSDIFINEAEQWISDLRKEGQDDFFLQTKPAKETSPHILFVDDNPDMHQYIGRLLMQVNGWQVQFAGNGREALEAIEKQPPDLILTDIIMPQMDGLELLKSVRTNNATKHIPVILLTARAGNETKVEGIIKGADDYLVKPFSAKELIARVQTNLKLIKMRRQIIEQEQKAIYEQEFAKKKDEYTELLKRAYEEIETKVTFRNQEALKTIKQLEKEIEEMKRSK